MRYAPACHHHIAAQPPESVRVSLHEQVYSEGLHLMVPWFDRPIIYDVRARPSLINSQSGSKDLQTVRAGVTTARG